MCYTHVLHGGRWIVKSIACQAENWNGARYCKRNFLMKERKLLLPLWLFSIKRLILEGCEQTFCRKLGSLPQQHLPWHARRELFVSGHLALKNDSEVNFLLLQWFDYYIKMPLQSSCFGLANCTALEKVIYGQNKWPKWTLVPGPCFLLLSYPTSPFF